MRCEVCIDSLSGAREAASGGADRLELCGDLGQGGVTPTRGLVESVREAVSLPIMVMVRPRGGDFCYDADELQVMCREIRGLQRAGIQGFVFGILTPAGDIDHDACRRLLDEARPLPVTFHRAFDHARHPRQAWETLRELEIDRLLTSGQQRTAEEGIGLLRDLVAWSKDELVVMPGGGVRPQNAARILQETGAVEIHFSGSELATPRSVYQNPQVELELAPERPARRGVTSAKLVRQICDAVRSAGTMTFDRPGDQ